MAFERMMWFRLKSRRRGARYLAGSYRSKGRTKERVLEDSGAVDAANQGRAIQPNTEEGRRDVR